MDKLINGLYKTKELFSRFITLIISLFYMATNGISAYFCGVGLHTFIPKVIKNYNESNDDKLAFYLILTIILTVLILKFIKYFTMAVKTLILCVFPSKFY